MVGMPIQTVPQLSEPVYRRRTEVRPKYAAKISKIGRH